MTEKLHVVKSNNCSIQDAGRYGYERFGLSNSGAIDQYAYKMSNALLANDLDEPVIEINYSILEIVSSIDISISITGAPCTINVDGVAKKQWCVFNLKAGKNLVVDSIHSGTKVYVSFAGGLGCKLYSWKCFL